jgi:hypothetical protein
MDQASISFLENQKRNRAEYAEAVEKRRAKTAQAHLQGIKVASEEADVVWVA